MVRLSQTVMALVVMGLWDGYDENENWLWWWKSCAERGRDNAGDPKRKVDLVAVSEEKAQAKKMFQDPKKRKQYFRGTERAHGQCK
jgi:hypothetical protein